MRLVLVHQVVHLAFLVLLELRHKLALLALELQAVVPVEPLQVVADKQLVELQALVAFQPEVQLALLVGQAFVVALVEPQAVEVQSELQLEPVVLRVAELEQ